jgi:uncharacterized membrane protein
MTRAELKRNAREKLGGQLFGPNWVNAVLVMAIFYILTGAVNGIAGFGTLIMLVIGGPLSYGVAKLFLQQCDDGQKMNPTEVFKGFSEDFGGSFILYLLRYLFIALWSILLIIPGIVKMYSYSMAFFIKADHPSYDWRECLDASSQLTYGHKWDHKAMKRYLNRYKIKLPPKSSEKPLNTSVGFIFCPSSHCCKNNFATP